MENGPDLGSEAVALAPQRAKQPIHFNINVRVLPYRAMLVDGAEEQIERQDIEMQIRSKGLTFNKFAYDLSQYIPWGPWQEVHLFGYDKDSDEERRLVGTKQLRSHFLDPKFWGGEEKLKMLVEVHTKPAKKSAAKRANKPAKEHAAKKPKKAPAEKAPKVLKSAMDDVLCSATSSVVVDNASEEALEVVQSMASQTSAIVDNDMNFSTCDVVQPNVPSISEVAESNEQCGSSVVVDTESPIDWSLIEIAPPNEDEVDVPITEENMCDFLGIEEDETHEAPPSPPSEDVYITDEEDQQLLTEAAIPVDDRIAQEEEIAYDKENPQMYVGALFPSMEEFRMAIKQYAINNEIDIMEDYVHNYFSLDKFRAAYAGEIEPMTDRSQWPHVDAGFDMDAPIDKGRPPGRPRKQRYKSALEGGKGGPKKKEPKQLGSQNRCKRCQELGHRQAGCPLNGPKKRKRKQRARTYPAEDEEPGPQSGGAPVGTPNRQIGAAPVGTPNRQMITIPASLHDSPGPVTRRMLAMALADESSQPTEEHVPTEMPSTSRARKLTPKRKRA